MEHYRLIINQQRLCIQFLTLQQKQRFLKDMAAHQINFFTEESGLISYIKPYTPEAKIGDFVSEHQRRGLAFLSEKDKFYFKQRIGLKAEHFMDMGPGYDAQMHFNEKFLPNVEGRFLIISYPNG